MISPAGEALPGPAKSSVSLLMRPRKAGGKRQAAVPPSFPEGTGCREWNDRDSPGPRCRRPREGGTKVTYSLLAWQGQCRAASAFVHLHLAWAFANPLLRNIVKGAVPLGVDSGGKVREYGAEAGMMPFLALPEVAKALAW